MIETAACLLYERGEELARRLAEGRDAYRPRIAVLNGIPHTSLKPLAAQAGELIVQQHRRDACLDLQRDGHAIRRDINNGPFDLVLVLAGKQREQTMGWLAQGTRLLSGSTVPGGGILALCAANDMGARGYEKRLSESGAELSISSKAKCRFTLLHADSIRHPDVPDAWVEAAAPRLVPELGLVSCPGVFSWEHIDRGSQLLLEHIPEGLAGRGMDLGCGNGYLSCHVLPRYPDLREWHAVDVDAVAIECAEQNLRQLAGKAGVRTHWLDATRERMPGGMDVVLLNPPFHKDKADLVSLGRAMIMAARGCMRPNGSLFLVANRHLPYELELYQGFESVSTLFTGDGYKVLRCDGVREEKDSPQA